MIGICGILFMVASEPCGTEDFYKTGTLRNVPAMLGYDTVGHQKSAGPRTNRVAPRYKLKSI